jgi:hypothetical protein
MTYSCKATPEEIKMFHKEDYEFQKSGLIEVFTKKKYEQKKRNLIEIFSGMKYEEVDLNTFLVMMLRDKYEEELKEDNLL